MKHTKTFGFSNILSTTAYRLLIILLLGFALGSSCKLPFTENLAGTGASLTLVLTSNQGLNATEEGTKSRTILPELPSLAGLADSFELTLTSQLGFTTRTATTTSANPSISISDLEFGPWDLSIRGYKTGILSALGQISNLNISAESNPSVSVLMAPLQSTDGSGNLNLTISFPDSAADSLTWWLEKTDGSRLVEETTASLSGNLVSRYATLSADNIPSGTYSLILSFRQTGESVGIFREGLTIFDTYTSDKWLDSTGTLVSNRSFVAGDFFDASASLANLVLSPEFSNFSFSPGTTVYSLGSRQNTSLRFTPSAGLTSQNISYTWNASTAQNIISGALSDSLVMVNGVNTLEITVQAPNKGTEQSYTITVYGSPAAHYISSSGIEMISVEGGTFQRDGSATNTNTVSSFLMAKYTVTQKQWRAVMGVVYPGGTADQDYPIGSITWYDALEYCNKLSITEGLEPVYGISNRVPDVGSITGATITMNLNHNGYRLPSRTEWMWAAMGGIHDARTNDVVAGINREGYTKAYAGSIEEGDASTRIGEYAWTASNNSPNGIKLVGTKLPNELGIYDLTGNIFQWNWNDWDEPAGANTNYFSALPASGYYRLHLGSTFSRADLEKALGQQYAASSVFADVGFRVVRNSQPLYSISYNANSATGGSAPTNKNRYARASSPALAANTGNLAKTGGYFLAGWNTLANGSGTSYPLEGSLTNISANTTLYAKWQPIALWAKSPTAYSAAGNSSFYSVKTDSTGKIYAAGFISAGTTSFGGTSSASVASTRNATLAMFDSNGTAISLDSLSNADPSTSEFTDLCLDSNNRIWVSGYLAGVGSFVMDGEIFNSGSSSTQAMLMCFAPNGDVLIKKLFSYSPGNGILLFNSITTDAAGNVYVAGELSSGSTASDMGNGISLTPDSNFTKPFIAKFRQDGTTEWVKTTTITSNDAYFSSLALDSSGNIYAVGTLTLNASYDFGNSITQVGNANYNGVLVKYASNGTTLWARTQTNIGGASGITKYNDIAISSTGMIYVVGRRGSAAQDFGHAVSLAGGIGSTNNLVLCYNSNGLTQWVSSTLAISPTYVIESIKLDNQGNLYTAWLVQAGTHNLGNAVSVTTTGTTSVLLKQTSLGLSQWAYIPISGVDNMFLKTTLAPDNSIIVAGALAPDTIYSFGPNVGVASINATNNALLVKYAAH